MKKPTLKLRATMGMAMLLVSFPFAAIAQTLSPQIVPLPKPPPARTAPQQQLDSPVASDADETVSLPQKRPTYDKPPTLPIASPSPAVIYQAACPVVLSGEVKAEIVDPIDADGCGTQSPFQISQINLGSHKIELATPATLNCSMATALVQWARKLDQTAKSQAGSRLQEIHTGTSYMCRRRNNAKTGKISEHGFANALDVRGFTLADKTKILLPEAWSGKLKVKRFIRASHKSACSVFTTVLGPDANALHRDHLHVDMGCHGQSCTYKLCE